jgi:hypothetical protein
VTTSDICSINECAKKVRARGLCATHWSQWHRRGDIEAAPLRRPPSNLAPPEAFRFYMPEEPPTNGCWLWRGSILSKDEPYGIITCCGTRYLAHRLSYEIFVGPIPDGLIVRHNCDTPSCVQPLDFLLGTQPDNVQDKVNRNRQSRGASHTSTRGSRHPGALLSESDVLKIRAMSTRGWTNRALADKFRISTTNISLIINRKTWRHI